jgi:hypothetical protein
MSTHFDLQPAIAACRAASAASQVSLVQLIARQGKAKNNDAVYPSPRAGRNFFAPIVKWITLIREVPGQYVVHRAAQADFNVRAGKAAWRYTTPTALFFCRSDSTKTPTH